MLKCLNKIWFWLENSRIFTVPMSVFSWLVAFVFAYTEGGNWFYGILALAGICLGQLATNLFDDYIDYKKLKELGTLENQTKAKCKYIKEGYATLSDVLKVVIIYCSIATLIGAYLFFKTGYPVIIFALLGAIFVLTYAKWSSAGIGEIAVGLAFGPILFGGVYWVMMQSLTYEIFLIGSIVVMFTIGLLYTNALLDYDGDELSHKKTLCQRFKNKNQAVAGFGIIYGMGYGILLAGVLSSHLPYIFLITFFTFPLVIELIISMLMFNTNKEIVPPKRFWHFPFENWNSIKTQDVASFRFRMYQARNIMIYTSLLICVAKIISVYF